MRTPSPFVEGIVVDTSDPQQMGRVKILCPSIDGDSWRPEDLPWANYVSPMAGQTRDYPAGSSSGVAPGPHSYGFWAVPKIGATVIVGFLYDDYNLRFYFGSTFPDHGNRSLPAGRNSSAGPITDILEPSQPTVNNLKAQFGGSLDVSEAKTRGAYERQVAQAADNKDGTEGYQKGVLEDGLDPQTYCWVTPGRHVFVMQDNPSSSRIRLRTAEGAQVIIDDANERIYVSTAKGKSWLEMDQDGHVSVYAAESFSVSTGGDFNLSAKGNINLHAGGNLNLAAVGHGRLSACADISLSSDGNLNLQGGGQMNLLAAGSIIQTGSTIHLNGPGADSAPCADTPALVPTHEPWSRPATTGARNKNWKA
jgi:hypothetical protein